MAKNWYLVYTMTGRLIRVFGYGFEFKRCLLSSKGVCLVSVFVSLINIDFRRAQLSNDMAIYNTYLVCAIKITVVACASHKCISRDWKMG